MLNFIKSLFVKNVEENIELEKLGIWLDEKTKPLFKGLSDKTNEISRKTRTEKEKALNNIKKLENAKLQNPDIPVRVKTIVQGNRASFIKRVLYFLANTDLKYGESSILDKCKGIEKEISILAATTEKSYKVLNEFFAREVESIAINIKNIENYTKEIKNLFINDEISNINKIKDNIVSVQLKISLREELLNKLKNSKDILSSLKAKQSEIEKSILGLKTGKDFKDYEKLLEQRKALELGLRDTENRLFHDFSVLEKALKKYEKIAFENNELIGEYIKNPMNSLIKDIRLEIISVLGSLEKNIIENKLGLDKKKSEKSLIKIKELEHKYLAVSQNNYKDLNEKLDKIKLKIENSKVKNKLELYEKELSNISRGIEQINNEIARLNNEIGKIDVLKLKRDLQEEISNAITQKIRIL